MEKGEKNIIGYEVKNLNNILTRTIAAGARRESNDELTAMHSWILGFLYKNKEKEIFQKDIEAEFSIGRSTVTNILQLMEKKNYIQREPVEQDARLKKITMTPKGIEMHMNTRKMLNNLEAQMAEGISEEDLKTFFAVLRKVKSNLEKERT